MTESALLLMRQLPVARNAVLSYFGRRFDDAANRYLQNRVDKVTGNLYNSSTPAYNGKCASTLRPSVFLCAEAQGVQIIKANLSVSEKKDRKD